MELRSHLLSAALVLAVSTHAEAQPTGDSVRVLTRGTAIRLAFGSNRTLQQSTIDEMAAAARYRETDPTCSCGLSVLTGVVQK